MQAKNKTIKFISAFVIISILVPTVLFSRPKKAEAFIPDFLNAALKIIGNAFAAPTATSTVTTASIGVKGVAERILQQVLMTITGRLLQQMTKSTVNWINSGFHGSPLFLQNPGSFFKDIAKFEVKNLVDLFGYDRLKYPFGQAFALNAIDAYKRQLAENAQYSLSRVINDPLLLDRYRNDFNVGGWNGFLINTQYPQNNYLGFQLLATEELARRLQGTTQNAAQKVQTTLQQGMGFLSPQTCLSNPSYNNGANEFQRPSFDYSKVGSDYEKSNPRPTFGGDDTYQPTPEENAQLADWQRGLDNTLDEAKLAWSKTNACPGGLVNTTPGSVVANQITTAMGTTFGQTVLASQLGNSISAIVDSLLNHFLDKGLSALASTVNPAAPIDTWSYNGQTLGSPTGANSAWDAGPDQEIILDDFKKLIDGETDRIAKAGDILADGTAAKGGEIIRTTGNTGNGTFTPGAIANTQTELQLMSNEDVNKPGITEMLGAIWPKSRELDICIPGPDLGWQARTDSERDRNSAKLQEKSSSDDGEKAANAQLAFNELKFAVDFFKDWINNQMMLALPNSVIYMDAVDQVKDLSQLSTELINSKRAKMQALARLQSIKTALGTITTQPAPHSDPEKILISLKKQYDATSSVVSNSGTIENSRNELLVLKDQYNNLLKLIAQCGEERTAKGWSNPGGANSTFSGTSSGPSRSGTEKELFCDAPIAGGYNHESFSHENDQGGHGASGRTNGGNGTVTYPELPYVNADDVLKFRTIGSVLGSILSFGGADTYHHVDISLSCNIIYNANVLDYKGNLPGLTTVAQTYVPFLDDTGNSTGTGGTAPVCIVPNGLYEGDLRAALDATAAENPNLVNVPFTPDSGRAFLGAVAAKLQSSGFNATIDVLNGNDVHGSSGDLIALWKNGDSLMERYDALTSGAGNIADHLATQFTGQIALNCTYTGGGSHCQCAQAPAPGGTVGFGGTGTITGTLNPSGINIVNAPADVMSWAETTQITNVDFSGDWRFDFSKKDGPGRWPDQAGGPGIASTDTIQYTVWLFLNINGQWYGSGFIQMWFGRAQAGGNGPTLFSQLPTNWYYGSAWSPMTPAVSLHPGDRIGFMVTSGNSRNGGVPQFKERSNIVLVTLQ